MNDVVRTYGTRGWNTSIVRQILPILLILVATFICYGRSLDFDFVYDDRDEMLERPLIHSLGSIPQFFTSTTYGYYRPVRTLVWAVDYALWGKSPRGYHLTNILLYAFCCWATFLFAANLLKSRSLGLLAALVFLVHPLHVESVAWISGRGDALAAGFLFLALWLALRWIDKPRGIFLFFSLLLSALSILSKEFGVVFFLLIASMAFCYRGSLSREESRRAVLVATAGFIVAVALMGLRSILLGGVAPGGSFAPMMLSERIAFSSRAFWRYIGLMLFPLRLSVDHAANTQLGLLSPVTLLSFAGHAALLALCARMIREGKSLPAYCIAWLYVAYIPVSHVVPLNQLFSEKYMFLSVFAPSLILPWMVGRLGRPANWKWILTILLIFAFAGRSIERNGAWRDNMTLWSRTLADRPESGLAAYNLAYEYDMLGEISMAEALYRRGISVRPEHGKQYQNLANILMTRGQYQEALVRLQQAKKRLGEMSSIYSSMSGCYLHLGDTDAAMEAADKAIELDPDSSSAHYNRGLLLMALGKEDEAQKEFQISESLGQPADWSQ